jgi:AraC-like DNA-binding protein
MSQKETEEGWRVMVFFLPDSYLQQFYKKYRAELNPNEIQKRVNTQMIQLEVNETTERFFHSMIPFFTQNPPPTETLLELKFRELLFHLVTNPKNINFLHQLLTIAECHRQSLSDVMNANFTYNLSLTEFAKLAHLSLASFKREFKKVFQTSPGKWLVQKKLDYACQLISTSTKSIQDISFESGFESKTHFSRVFRAKFGISPLQYRKEFMASAIPF